MKKILLTIFLTLALWSCGSVKKSSNETDLSTEDKKNKERDATKFSNSFIKGLIALTSPIEQE